jgi:hypothetical protein
MYVHIYIILYLYCMTSSFVRLHANTAVCCFVQNALKVYIHIYVVYILIRMPFWLVCCVLYVYMCGAIVCNGVFICIIFF